MWENKTAQQGESEAGTGQLDRLRPPPAPREEGPDYLLRAQILVCVVLAVLAALLRQLGLPVFETLRQEYRQAMEPPAAAQAAVQFAAGLLTGAQQQAQAALEEWRQQLEAGEALNAQGAGGIFPVKEKNLPDGYSLEDCPVEGELAQPLSWYNVTSEYGWRKHPLTGQNDFHTGIDLANAEGAPISPVREGIVLKTGCSVSYGNYLQVMHADGLVSVYCHLQYIFVRAGEWVQPGQILGTVGSTGVSTGPHLHLELICDGVHYDPAAALGLA